MGRTLKGLTMASVALHAAAEFVHAQYATVTYSWSWSEVVAHSSVPSAATPGVIDPTEGVRLVLHANYAPGPGNTVMYFPPPGTGVGTVVGWAGCQFDLLGSAGAQGTFDNFATGPGFFPADAHPLSAPSIVWGAISVALLGGPISAANPIDELASLTWTPTSYAPRSVSFMSRDTAVQGHANSMFIQYGIGPTGLPLITDIGALANHGTGTGPIVIVPGPAGLATIAVGSLVLIRRRRGSTAGVH